MNAIRLMCKRGWVDGKGGCVKFYDDCNLKNLHTRVQNLRTACETVPKGCLTFSAEGCLSMALRLWKCIFSRHLVSFRIFSGKFPRARP